MDPTFSSLRLSLLDRGFVFAIAHVRGGGELGRHWYEEGKFAAKPNTFTDFVACARHLVDEGWTSPGPAGGPGRQRRRAADGGRGQPGPRPVPGRRRRGALRRLPDHHPRRDPAPHRHSSGRSGATRSRTPRSTRVMKSYSPYDNVRSTGRRRAPGPVSRHPGHRRPPTPGSASGSRPSGWPSCGPPTRRTGSC